MNPTEAIEFLTKQANFCADRALAEVTVDGIRMYATRADIYYTLASTMAILFGSPTPKISGSLGDADDAAALRAQFEVEGKGAK